MCVVVKLTESLRETDRHFPTSQIDPENDE